MEKKKYSVPKSDVFSVKTAVFASSPLTGGGQGNAGDYAESQKRDFSEVIQDKSFATPQDMWKSGFDE